MSACDPARTSARTEIGDGFDLHQDFPPAQEIALLQAWKQEVSGERSPDLGVFLDIDDADRHLYQVVLSTGSSLIIPATSPSGFVTRRVRCGE
jgi:hypothetical protein